MNIETKQTTQLTLVQLETIRAIKHKGINTRTALCEHLGISRSTATPLISDMIAKGIVVENGIAVNKRVRGRNSTLLTLNEGYRLIIGITIESESIQIMLSTMGGESVHKITAELQFTSYHDLLSLIVKLVETLVSDNVLSDERILGIGIAVSESAQEYIDGTDKLTRIRKDLSFALNYRISTMSLRIALLTAQCVFTVPRLKGTVALIRLDKDFTFDYMIDTTLSRPKVPRVSLFDGIDILGERATSELATAINQYDRTISPSKIFLMGELKYGASIIDINHELEDKYKQKVLVEPFFISDSDIGKAGCAVAINDVFKVV